MAGHLFVTRGSATDLHCDALLVPSGIGALGLGHVGRESWWPAIPPAAINSSGYVVPAPSPARRVVRVADGRADAPAIWLGHTGEDDRPPAWYAEAARAFVTQAAGSGACREARPVGDRRPLLAMPLVGSGAGGAAGSRARWSSQSSLLFTRRCHL